MNKQIIKIVLPQLARRLHRHVQRYRSGKLTEAQFGEQFQALLERQHDWLAERGVPPLEASVAVHGAILVLTGPGMRAEAEERKLPLEVIEYRAIRSAAAVIAGTHDVSELRTFRQLSAIVAQYGE